MKIWIISYEEIAPTPDQEAQRLKRMGILTKYLSDRGNKVIWWSSGFMHAEKKYLYKEFVSKTVNENLTVNYLYSRVSYNKNISIKRLIYTDLQAQDFKKHVDDFQKPDLILCSYPSEQLCRVSVDYGFKHHVPVILDARDQWPDIFEWAFPRILRPLVRILLIPMKRRAEKTFSRADAICAISPIMLQWALDYAKRPRNKMDKVIFTGSKREKLQPSVLRGELEAWCEQGVSDKTWNICLFSTLSKRGMDIDTAIDAVSIVHNKYPQIRFVIGGTGDDEQRLREYTKNMDFILMPGWLNLDQMCSLMSISKAGLTCYRNLEDMKNGWGNRIGQYLSYGLPILTSAEGISKEYVEQYGCGCAYKENDSRGLASILFKLIEHPEEQEKMSESAFKRYQLDFDEQVVVKKFEDEINNVYNTYMVK